MTTLNTTTTDHEVIKLTKEALDLLTTAVHFDKANSLVGACDFYDLAILNWFFRFSISYFKKSSSVLDLSDSIF